MDEVSTDVLSKLLDGHVPTGTSEPYRHYACEANGRGGEMLYVYNVFMTEHCDQLRFTWRAIKCKKY